MSSHQRLEMLGRALSRGKYEKAIRMAAELGRSKGRAGCYSRLLLGRAFLGTGHWSLSIKVFRQAGYKCRNKKARILALQGEAEATFKAGRYRRARTLYKKLYHSRKGHRSLWLARLRTCASRLGDKKRQRELRKQLAVKYPCSSQAWKLKPFLRLSQREALARARRLISCGHQGQKRAARELLNRCPGKADGWCGEAGKLRLMALYRCGRIMEAHRMLKKLGNAGIHNTAKGAYWSAKLDLRGGRYLSAAGKYRSFRRKWPRHKSAVTAIFNEAYAWFKLRAWLKSDTLFKKFLQRRSWGRLGKRARWLRAWIGLKRKKYRLASRRFRNIERRYRSLRKAARYWRGRALLAARSRKAARRIFSSLAIESLPSYYGLLAGRELKNKWPGMGRINRGRPPRPPRCTRLAMALAVSGVYDLARIEFDHLSRTHCARSHAFLFHWIETGGYYSAMKRRHKWPGNINYAKSLSLVYPLAFRREVVPAAQAAGMDPLLVFTFTLKESSFRPWIRSGAGARGLMQLMPDTARSLCTGQKLESDTDLHQPRFNLSLGARYLSMLSKSYKGELVLMAAHYNAGPIAVSQWLKDLKYLPLDEFVEEISFKETRKYVKRITTMYARYRMLSGHQPLRLARKLQYPTGQSVHF